MSDGVNLRIMLIGQTDNEPGDVYLAPSGDYLLVFGNKRNELSEVDDCNLLGESDAYIEDHDPEEIETYASGKDVRL